MLGRVKRARVAILPDADCEVSYVADFVNRSNAIIIAPAVYDSIFRSWNITNGQELFAVPIHLSETVAARALLGAYGLARQQFNRRAVWNYLHAFTTSAAELQREFHGTSELPADVKKFLSSVLELMSPSRQTIAGYCETAEVFLRNSVEYEQPRLFEILYQHSEDETKCSREEFVRNLREWLQIRIDSEGAVPIRRDIDGVDSVGVIVLVGCYEGAPHLGNETAYDSVSLISMPLLSPEKRQATYPHHFLLRELRKADSRITSSNYLNASSSDIEVFLNESDLNASDSSSLEPVVQRATEVIGSRLSDEFSVFDGNIGDDIDIALPRPTYVSFLDRYSACPLQTFFDHELKIDSIDDATETIGIAPVDRGVIVHEILQHFLVSAPPRETPDQEWTQEEREQFSLVIDQVFDEYRDKAGDQSASAFWSAEEQTVRVLLATFLDDDEKFRKENGVIPAHQEVWFGGASDHIPAVTLANNQVEIALRGRVDRIDQSPGGERIIITDYKTGNASYASTLKDGPLEDGELQLPVYAEAVQKVSPDATVSAQQWFVLDPKRAMPGFVYDSDLRNELQEELLTIANDYKTGWFPANPGDELPWGYTNCQHCPYDRICPADRGDAFARKVGVN
jgi:hypothetical protein